MLGEYGAQNGRQRDDRTHRQVDAARHDHERHADRDDKQERVVDEQAEQYLQREESGVHHGAEAEQHDEQKDGDDDRQGARIDQAVEKIPHFAASARGFFRAYGKARFICRMMTVRAVADWITLTTSTTVAFTTSVASGGTPMEYVV